MIEITDENVPEMKMGDTLLHIDPRHFRPAEAETLLEDLSKARDKLAWPPEIAAREMVAEMVAEDLQAAKRAALLRRHGHSAPIEQGPAPHPR